MARLSYELDHSLAGSQSRDVLVAAVLTRGGYNSRRGFGDVAGPQDLVQRFAGSGGLNGSGKLYVRAVTISEDGKHAQAECVR